LGNAAHYSVGIYGGGSLLTAIKDTIDPNTGTYLATYGDLASSPGLTGSRSYTNWNLEQIYDPSVAASASSFFPSTSTSELSTVTYIARDLTNPNGLPSGAWNVLTSFGTASNSGAVVDGHISGATVFADSNSNGQLDSGEVSTTTDQNGNFNLSGGSGALIAFGGTDISTGRPFKGQLSAPQNSTVVSPLTTLLNDLSSDPSAETNILAALGLPATLDLTTLDPISAAQGDDTGGAAAYVAGARVYDTVSLIASALAGSGGSFARGAQDAFSALATALDGAGINLADTTALSALVNSIASGENLTLSPGVADDVVAVSAPV
jgi:hypothetical protein